MTRRIVIALFFSIGLLISLIWWMPVRFLLSMVEDQPLQLEAATGTLASGSVVASNDEIKALPIGWKVCSLKLTQPIGICVDITSKDSNMFFGIVPWKLGQSITLYNLSIDSPLASLADLAPSLGILRLVEGHVYANFSQLVFNQELQKLEQLAGDIQLEGTAALGLNMGDINIVITQNTAGEIFSLSFEGGDVNELVLMGSGSFDPIERRLSLRTIFKSNKPSVLNQLASFAKQSGDNTYEWIFSGTL